MVIVWEWGIYPQKAEYHIGGNHASSIKQIKVWANKRLFYHVNGNSKILKWMHVSTI